MTGGVTGVKQRECKIPAPVHEMLACGDGLYKLGIVRRIVGLVALLWITPAFAHEPAHKIATPDIPRKAPEGNLVLPFLNASGVAGLEWLRAGLAAELAEKLEQHPGLRSLNGETIVPEGTPGTVDAAGIAAAAAKVGARWVWTGSYSRPNWRLEINVRLWSVENGAATLVAEKRERGDFSDAFELLDDAIAELLAAAQRPMPAPAVARAQPLPPQDFYAFPLYGRGLEDLVGLGRPPDLVKSAKELSRSVFIDPKFAEAHRMLAVLHRRKGELGAARGQLNYALDLQPDYYAPIALLARM